MTKLHILIEYDVTLTDGDVLSCFEQLDNEVLYPDNAENLSYTIKEVNEKCGGVIKIGSY